MSQTNDSRVDVRQAAERIKMMHFHEDEPSPLLDPEGDNDVRDDCLAVADAVLAFTRPRSVSMGFPSQEPPQHTGMAPIGNREMAPCKKCTHARCDHDLSVNETPMTCMCHIEGCWCPDFQAYE